MPENNNTTTPFTHQWSEYTTCYVPTEWVEKQAAAYEEIAKIAREHALIWQAADGIIVIQHPNSQLENGDYYQSLYMSGRLDKIVSQQLNSIDWARTCNVTDVTTLAKFMEKYYRPDKYTGRGDKYARKLLATYEEELYEKGFVWIGHRHSITGKDVSFIPHP